VRVEASTPDGARGSLEYQFDATGFGPNCDPNTPPNFDVHRGEGAARRAPANAN
jgi:hypothetical protein